MATIIAAGFETYVEAQDALARLQRAGVNSEYLCEFRVNPPGMHDETPIGGDRDESPGAQHAESGATKGAALRQAQLAFLADDQRHAHPFFWAPFFLVGNAGAL